MDHVDVMIAQPLDLDVPRLQHQLFHVHFIVAEGAQRLAPRIAQRRFQIRLAIDAAHSLSAAAGRGLEQHRIADLAGDTLGFLNFAERLLCSRHHRRARRDRHLPRRRFRSHPPDRRRRRPDKDDAGGGARFSKLGVFAQKPVAGMNRLSAMPFCGIDDLIDAQIALRGWRRAQMGRFIGHPHRQRGAVGVGVNGDARNSKLAQRADDSHRDLAAISHQNFTKHEGSILAGNAKGIRRAPSVYFSVTTVAPHPPASAGASWYERTRSLRASTWRTVSRCTPMPRPWIIRSPLYPARLASIRFFSTTAFTSRGETECRSSTSSIGMRSGSSDGYIAAGSKVLMRFSRLYTLEPAPRWRQDLSLSSLRTVSSREVTGRIGLEVPGTRHAVLLMR